MTVVVLPSGLWAVTGAVAVAVVSRGRRAVSPVCVMALFVMPVTMTVTIAVYVVVVVSVAVSVVVAMSVVIVAVMMMAMSVVTVVKMRKNAWLRRDVIIHRRGSVNECDNNIK